MVRRGERLSVVVKRKDEMIPLEYGGTLVLSLVLLYETEDIYLLQDFWTLGGCRSR